MENVKETVKEAEGKIFDMKSNTQTVESDIEPLNNAAVYSLYHGVRNLLAAGGNMPGNVAYGMGRNVSKLESKLKSIDKYRYENFLSKYVKKDGKGEFVITVPTEEEKANGVQPKYVYLSPEAEQKCMEETEEYMKQPANIDFYKVKLESFNQVMLASPVRFIDLITNYLIEE